MTTKNDCTLNLTEWASFLSEGISQLISMSEVKNSLLSNARNMYLMLVMMLVVLFSTVYSKLESNYIYAIVYFLVVFIILLVISYYSYQMYKTRKQECKDFNRYIELIKMALGGEFGSNEIRNAYINSHMNEERFVFVTGTMHHSAK